MNKNTNWLWGGLLIGLGVIFLLNQLFPGLFSGIIWGSAFTVAGLVLYGVYRKNRQHWWVLIPAYISVAVASYIFIGIFRFIPGEFVAAWVMATIGFPFLAVYLLNRAHWWALIPAYTMAVIGAMIPLTLILNGFQITSYIMFAIAAPFFYVYLRNRAHWWALIPGGVMAALGGAFLLAGAAYLIPAMMIVAGIYLLIRQSGGSKKADTVPEPFRSTPRPLTGPEADRPFTEFEPIGRKVNQPETEIQE